MAETRTTTPPMPSLPGAEQWKKLADDHGARMGQLFDELGRAHAKWVEFGTTQLEGLGELTKAQVTYATELATGMRTLTTEATKKALELFKV